MERVGDMDRSNGEITPQYGAQLRAGRRSAGLTQQELADLAGVGLAAIRDLEQGRRSRPRPRTATRLGEALVLAGAAATVPGRAVTPPEATMAGAAGRAGKPAGHATSLWVQTLGPLAVWRDGRLLDLGPPRQRAVLGRLALSPDHQVHRETLVDVLWGEDPPVTAVNMVQAYVSRLRRVLDPRRSPRDNAGVLVSSGATYRLHALAGQLDLLEFGRLCAEARASRAAGDVAVACDLYEKALELWHGVPLADLEFLRGHPAVAGLTSQQAAVVTEYAQVAASAGWHDRVLAHVRALAGRDPLNEKAHAQLMIALSGCGQQAAALGVFEGIRRRLDDQLGIRPGSELSQARMRVLRQEIRMPDAAPVLAVVPRQLPPAARHFAGREEELRKLSEVLDEVGGPGRAVVISAIGGTAGVGKTALAVHWAHQVASRFPDGQLYVNLRGFDASGTPSAPGHVLRGFLNALQVPDEQIPPDLDARTAFFRSLVADKRLLIVADNARDEQQVRPLLPGSPGCLVVVTSRCELAGLVSAQGACALTLDVLSAAEARELLARRLGDRRVAAEPEAVANLTRLCASLPLALSVAAARAAMRPSLRLADLVAELRDARDRPGALVTGDQASSVRTVLSWSYDCLDAPAARMFRLLGLHPGPDITIPAAASLAALPLDHARKLFRELTRVNLLAEHASARFTFHDLLRAYAAQRVESTDSPDERRAALTRLFDHYLAASSTAMGTLADAERHRPTIPTEDPSLPPLDTADAARTWLDERATFVAIAEYTSTHGRHGHATRMATVLSRYYLNLGAAYADAIAMHTSALRAGLLSGDRAAQADALWCLGTVDFQHGHARQAADQLWQALASYRELGDHDGLARTFCSLGVVSYRQAQYEAATGHLRQALASHRELGDQLGEAVTLDFLGIVLWRRGHLRQAASRHRRALALFREIAFRRGEACAIANLGAVSHGLGRYQEAAGFCEQARAVFRELGDRGGEAGALQYAGAALCAQSRYEQAADHHRKALTIFRELGDLPNEARALNGLGDAMSSLGQPEQGSVHHHSALTLARQAGDRYLEARSHNCLAGAYRACGAHDQAHHHWQQALVIYTSLGVHEAGQIRAALDTGRLVDAD